MSGEFSVYEGNVSFGLIDQTTGNFLGYSQPVECNIFKPSRKQGSVTTIRSKQRGGRYNGTINQTYGAPTYSLEMDFVELPPSVLSILFASSAVPVNITAGTFTAVSIPLGALDASYNIGHRNIKTATSPPLVKDSTGVTTYVLNTDYTIDGRIGFITPLSTGSIVANSTITVSGAFDILTGTQYDGETNPIVFCQVFFDGKNLITKTDFSMEYYKVQIPAPDNMLDLLAEVPSSAVLIGTPFTPASKNAPYRVTTNIPTTAL
jgi:hypothetical protein